MLKHNSYFEGQVQSVGFERLGRRQSVGVIDVGAHTFGTEAPERMTVVSGELVVTLKDAKTSKHYPAGTSFEVPGQSSFEVRAEAPAAYLCEYL
jgi:uncharacterized protein YaiE (UPF0345 family)